MIFDSSLEAEQSKASSKILDLTQESDFQKFNSIFVNVSDGKLGHSLHRSPVEDTRPVGILDERLQRKCKETLDNLKQSLSDDPMAFDYWVQLFLIAILRDCSE